MPSVETGQMSATGAGQMSAVETRRMSTIATGRCPVSIGGLGVKPGNLNGSCMRDPVAGALEFD